MPFGDNDWLALTSEPTLEPELPICDPHHHFWDFRTDRIPYQRYLLHELIADIQSGHNVRSTVFIEARAMYRADRQEEMRRVGEVEFVQGLAAASALRAGDVGRLYTALEAAITYLACHAQRAHPKRDRATGRSQLGLEPLFGSDDAIELAEAA